MASEQRGAKTGCSSTTDNILIDNIAIEVNET